jgi:hypothetical protein
MTLSSAPLAVRQTIAQSHKAPNSVGVWRSRLARYYLRQIRRAVIVATVCTRYSSCRSQTLPDNTPLAYRTPKDNNVQKSSAPPKTRGNKIWYWLLIIPYLAIAWLPSYNRIEPRAFGIPFFYWYQLLWVVLSTLIIGVVLYLVHMRKRSLSKQN